MVAFSKPRLEGRALEHGLSQDGGHTIRMKDGTGKFTAIGGAEAREIRKDMRERADKLVEDMASQGLFKKGADCHVKVPEGTTFVSKSVDLRVRVAEKETEAILEVKWTRRHLSNAAVAANTSVPWLKKACLHGRWASSGKPIQAGAVGTLVVSPGSWLCHMQAADGSWSRTFPRKRSVPQKSRSGSNGRCGYRKRKGDPEKEAVEKEWRNSPKGKALTKKLLQSYRATDKGTKVCRESNEKRLARMTVKR